MGHVHWSFCSVEAVLEEPSLTWEGENQSLNEPIRRISVVEETEDRENQSSERVGSKPLFPRWT